MEHGLVLVEDQWEVSPRWVGPTTKLEEGVDQLLSPSYLKRKLNENALNSVLGVIEGPHFVPDGVSRNNRFYSKELWQKQMVNEEVLRKLSTGQMIGTLLHPKTEGAAHPEKGSHIVKKLWINESNGMGYGKTYLVNTPMGAIIQTFASATDESGESLIKFFVSSRAYAKYTEQKHKGVPKLDPNHFILETFDFVFDPGFFEASPMYQGVINEAYELYRDKEFYPTILVEENHKSEEVITPMAKTDEQLEVSALQTILEEHKGKIAAYEAIGTPDEIQVALGMAKQRLESYSALGSPAQISESLVKLSTIEEGLKPLGTVEEITESMTIAKKVIDSYAELGKPEEVREALTIGKSVIESYKELGPVAELKELVESKKEIEFTAAIEGLVTEFKIKSETAKKLVTEADGNFESVRKVLVTINESKDDSTPEIVIEGKEESKKISSAQSFIKRAAALMA